MGSTDLNPGWPRIQSGLWAARMFSGVLPNLMSSAATTWRASTLVADHSEVLQISLPGAGSVCSWHKGCSTACSA